MKEIRDIIKAYDEAKQQGKRSALATVVHVEGSSYRQPGARMLVTEDGMLTGAISGGCLEGDALRKALLVINQQQPMLVTYDTSDEDDAKLGVGLGCNGIIQVLIEPIMEEKECNPLTLLKKLVERRQYAVLVTLFSMHNRAANQPGTCLLYTGDGEITGQQADGLLQEELFEDARKAISNRRSFFKNYHTKEKNQTAFIELVKPPVSLVIVGAGNDVMPLVEMAAITGWETTVIDGRTNYARKERFPKAKKVLLAKPGNVLKEVNIDDRTVFVLMTHNYNYDTAMVRQLLQQKVTYTGVLGPRKKMERILKELQEEGMTITGEGLSTIFGPVGLDVGAETAEEIALAIMAEIQAVMTGRKGGLLRDSTATIHAGTVQTIEQVTINRQQVHS